MTWTVYILECADKTLYTGITNDLEKRLVKHLDGTGAKYTRGRGPFKVRFSENFKTRGAALKREAAIKSLKKTEKIGLFARKARQ
jgi:predicted GIY-YIG superfamily endonuclease